MPIVKHWVVVGIPFCKTNHIFYTATDGWWERGAALWFLHSIMPGSRALHPQNVGLHPRFALHCRCNANWGAMPSAAALISHQKNTLKFVGHEEHTSHPLVRPLVSTFWTEEYHPLATPSDHSLHVINFFGAAPSMWRVIPYILHIDLFSSNFHNENGVYWSIYLFTPCWKKKHFLLFLKKMCWCLPPTTGAWRNACHSLLNWKFVSPAPHIGSYFFF